MKRWIYVSQTADRPLEQLWQMFREHGRDSLRRAGEDGLRADGSFVTRLQVEGFPLAPPLHLTIGVGAGMPDGRMVVPLRWSADTGELGFPHFEGSIELEPLSSSVTRVSIVGSYVPPLGALGAMVDAAMLHRAADATASALLARLVGGLLRAWEPDAEYDSPRILNMTVGDVMTVDPFVIDADLPLKTAALLLFHLDVSGAPVVGRGGELVGVITERDLLDKEASPPRGLQVFDDATWRRRAAMTAREACSSPAWTTAPGVSLHEAVSEMQRHGVGRLVVVDHAEIVGIVTRHDVLVALIRNDAEVLHVIKQLLQGMGEEHVDSRVDWGTVTLTGKSSLRSRRDEVVSAISNLDGVMGVDAGRLKWDVDDVLPAAMPPFG